jgi:D-alanine-D-alanine ligase
LFDSKVSVVTVETRILLLSNRLPEIDAFADEAAAKERAPVSLDLVAPVADHLLETLAAAPGVRVMHRSVLRPSEILAGIGEHRPDLVFNLCESLAGDSRLEVTAAWILERLGLPFTGSPYRTLRHCLYKYEANQMLARAGVPVPTTVRVDSPDRVPKRIAFPAIVKPEREDGSLGIEKKSVVQNRRRLRDQVAKVIATCKQPAIVQRYIHGREMAVSMLGWPVPRALPPGEILFGDLPKGYPHILTFDSKWKPDTVESVATPSMPAVLRPHELRRVVAVGRRAFEVLGLRDYGRIDVRLDESGKPWVIDVNPNCDLSDDGGFARAAYRAGMTYPLLVWEILRGAIRRRNVDAPSPFASRGRGLRLGRMHARAALHADTLVPPIAVVAREET